MCAPWKTCGKRSCSSGAIWLFSAPSPLRGSLLARNVPSRIEFFSCCAVVRKEKMFRFAFFVPKAPVFRGVVFPNGERRSQPLKNVCHFCRFSRCVLSLFCYNSRQKGVLSPFISGDDDSPPIFSEVCLRWCLCGRPQWAESPFSDSREMDRMQYVRHCRGRALFVSAAR